MIVALAYCTRDQDITLKLFDWITELGGCQGHKLLLCHDARCDADIVKSIYDSASKSFEVVRDIESKAVIDGWPEGANYFFRTIVAELSYQKPIKYWMWMEPDAIPLKFGWLDAIEAEYLKAKKPFMGDRVEVKDIPLHMSGIGVYPNPIYDFAGEANRAADTAWDMAAKDQIVPQAHFTKLIEHAWKHPTFTNQDELKTQIRPEAVLFHSSKDGSLIKLLREQKGGDASVCDKSSASWSETLGTAALTVTLSAAQGQGRHEIAGLQTDPILADIWKKQTIDGVMPVSQIIVGEPDPTYDIFIRTYQKDYPWLGYCLDSIRLYAKGFRKIWIVSPQEMPLPNSLAYFGQATGINIEWKVLNEESEDGYLSQQVHKLYADVITNYEADYILHMDSDVLFTQPVTPQDFFKEDKLIWYYTPYEHTETPWKPITEKFMTKSVANEFMRRLPMVIPKWLYGKLREYCHTMHGQILSQYIKNQPYREFSEFNAIGAFAYEKFRDKFEWVNTHVNEIPERCARQFYSVDGITDEYKKEIDQILTAVPVLAEPLIGKTSHEETVTHGGEVREGTESDKPRKNDHRSLERGAGSDSRGGGQSISTNGELNCDQDGYRPGMIRLPGCKPSESPRDHINALADYADLPWKRQYVLTSLKKQFKRKRKLAKV